MNTPLIYILLFVKIPSIVVCKPVCFYLSSVREFFSYLEADIQLGSASRRDWPPRIPWSGQCDRLPRPPHVWWRVAGRHSSNSSAIATCPNIANTLTLHALILLHHLNFCTRPPCCATTQNFLLRTFLICTVVALIDEFKRHSIWVLYWL